MKFYVALILTGFLTLSLSCNSGSSDTKSAVKMEDVFNELNNDLSNSSSGVQSTNSSSKQGIVKEVLNTERYSYLNLEKDDGSTFWIAISKQAVQIGDKIAFEDGILKHNFESKEFNRMFETIYLVSRFEQFRKNSANQSNTFSAKENIVRSKSEKESLQKGSSGSAPEGSIAISSIIQNPGKYQDEEVTIHGLVVKVNYNIMGRNWVHLQNKENKDFDLTITTNDQVMEGEEVTFTGAILLDQDFGAGYRYEVIMENAKRQ